MESKAYSYLQHTLDFERWREISRDLRTCWTERDNENHGNWDYMLRMHLLIHERKSNQSTGKYIWPLRGLGAHEKEFLLLFLRLRGKQCILKKYLFLMVHTYEEHIIILADSNTVFDTYAFIYFLSLITTEVSKWPLFSLATSRKNISWRKHERSGTKFLFHIFSLIVCA